MAESQTLQLIRSPKYETEDDVKVSFVDYRLLITLSNLHQNHCSAPCDKHPTIQEISASLTRILRTYRKDVKRANFGHYGAMWGYPETDSIEVTFRDGRETQYLLDRNAESFILSHCRLKHVPDAIDEKLQDEL